MAKKPPSKADPKFVVAMVRPDVPSDIEWLAAYLSDEASRKAGMPIRITQADAASIVIREGRKAREKPAKGSR